ncbi:MAG: membrane protein insertion efficiency factor YidD [Bacteroidales bacterium]|nr:membrane protein insertion efficiency factor YidD [Bacteroidales bacterium]
MILVILFFTGAGFAQTDWQRWEKKEVSYEKEVLQDSLVFDDSSVKAFLFSTLKNGYAFFISDHDGDNCPFAPTCSHFYVDAVKKTNIIQGTLMFADRFTRDSNLFKSSDQYIFHHTGKLEDPVVKYTLQQDSVNIYFKNHQKDK